MMGIFSKRVNKTGAILGMLAGIGVTMLYVFQHKGIMFIPGTSFLGGMDQNWFFGISPNAFGAVGALVNFVVAHVVSRMTAQVPDEIIELIEHIRVPKGAGAAQSDMENI
jgi:cation/acetate symporter